MPQKDVWEREYKNPKLVTKDDKPQEDVKRFLKFLKKEQGVVLENLQVLDLGSGTGRNGNYVAELGNQSIGLEISKTAVDIANTRAKELGVKAEYFENDIGSTYLFPDNMFDIALDVTSSNSLNETGREVHLKETHRVLKPGGYFFVKALCKEGDQNAKTLLKESPGKEKDTYIMKDLGLTERIWERADFENTYSPLFKILHLEKKTSYTRMKGRVYKRNFWIAYLQKN